MRQEMTYCTSCDDKHNEIVRLSGLVGSQEAALREAEGEIEKLRGDLAGPRQNLLATIGPVSERTVIGILNILRMPGITLCVKDGDATMGFGSEDLRFITRAVEATLWVVRDDEVTE